MVAYYIKFILFHLCPHRSRNFSFEAVTKMRDQMIKQRDRGRKLVAGNLGKNLENKMLRRMIFFWFEMKEIIQFVRVE